MMDDLHKLDMTLLIPGSHAAGTIRDGRELIRCATLAASSHNTQPWRFRVAQDRVTILPDRSRRCPVVDPDDAHLFKSLGCAAENLVQAALAQGSAADVTFDPTDDAVVVVLSPSAAVGPTALFTAIEARQCTRLPFDGTSLMPAALELLGRSGQGPGVRTVFLADRPRVDAIGELVAKGDMTQLTDRAFRQELISWIRFSNASAVRSGDGLSGRCTGNPSMPTWLAKAMSRLFIRAQSQAARDRQNVHSSAGIAVFVTTENHKSTWVEAGRAYQRFALQATVLNVRTAFINQPIELLELRSQFETIVGINGEHAQLAVRFGHGDLAPHSLRRPIDDVITS
jgi:hypothetical protein